MKKRRQQTNQECFKSIDLHDKNSIISACQHPNAWINIEKNQSVFSIRYTAKVIEKLVLSTITILWCLLLIYKVHDHHRYHCTLCDLLFFSNQKEKQKEMIMGT